MMEIDDIFINFIISYIAGSVPATKELLKKKEFQKRMDDSYQRALEKWCQNDVVRRSLSSRRFAYLGELCEYLKNPDTIKNDELLELWADELRADTICYDFILEIKMDTVIDAVNSYNSMLQKVNAKQDLIINAVTNNDSTFLRGLKTHKPIDGYIRRYCTSSKEYNDFIYYFNKDTERYTLADYVVGAVEEGNNKFILYSGAQTGKTTELRNLCWELQQSGLYQPVSYEVKTSADLKQEQMPRVRFVDEKEVVVIIDALDEINGKGREELLLAICSYAHDNPEMKMVLSCRSNYRREDKMEEFHELYLTELSYSDAQDHIDNCLGKGNSLSQQINKKDLAEFVKHPFFLNILIDAYQNSNDLPQNRADVYKLFIEKSYKVEKKQKATLDIYQQTSQDAIILLERVALAMSLMNKQTLTEREFDMCLGYDESKISECKRYGIIKYENEQYSFEHNAFREWLVAFYLYQNGIEKARKMATHSNGKIRPEWYNIIILWTSMYTKKDKQQVGMIVDWLKTASLELLIYSDRDTLDEETKNSIFKGVLLEYKSLGIRIANILSNEYRNLLDFGQSTDTLNFIADELENAHPRTAYFADLMCMCLFLKWHILKLQSKETFDRLIYVLEKKTLEELQQKPNGDLAYIYLENEFFAKKQYVDKYYTLIKDFNNYDAIKVMMSLIYKTNLGDTYIDYILDKEQYVHNQQEGSTTHIVSRHEVYRSLTTVTSAESINKILQHSFYDPHNYFRDEWEDYSKMMANCLQKATEYIKHGNRELITLVESSFFKHFGNCYNSYSHDINTEELLAQFRLLYHETGLDVEAKAEFDSKAKLMFVEGANRKTCEELYGKTGLWITLEMLDDYYQYLDKNNDADNNFASWFTECPIVEIAKAARVRNEAFFPEPEGIRKGRQRKESIFKDFANYDVFQQQVLESIEKMSGTNRKQMRKQMRIGTDEQLSDYVYRFIIEYVDDQDAFIQDEIIKAIKNKHQYEVFFMKIISDSLIHSTNDSFIDDSCRNRCIATAKTVVETLTFQPDECPYVQKALQLMLLGHFYVSENTLISLLPYSFVNVSKRDGGNFCSTYSLFDYLTEHISQDNLANAIIRMLEEETAWMQYHASSKFASFIIDNRIERGYSILLDYIVQDAKSAMNIAEMMLKADVLVKEIKTISDRMEIEDRLTIYSCMKQYQNADEWIMQKLEPKFKQFEGYALKQSLFLLLGIGSMEALQYLTTNPELLRDGRDYHFNYTNPTATSMLAYVLQYLHENKMYDYFSANSIYSSFEKIAVQSKINLDEVKSVLGGLVSKDEKYKYINRYIIMYESKFYEMNSPTKNIADVIKLIDAHLSHEESSVEDLNSQMEPIYISYNWESASDHVVDYFCFVLNTHKIPYRRDKYECTYKANIREFMDAIRSGQQIVVVLSRPYLKSPNCMYELTGIMQHSDYKNRILPVVTDDTIRDTYFYVELCRHWAEKKATKEELVKQLNTIDTKLAAPIAKKLAEVETIYNFLTKVKEYIDWTNAESLNTLSSTHFKSIIDKILCINKS